MKCAALSDPSLDKAQAYLCLSFLGKLTRLKWQLACQASVLRLTQLQTTLLQLDVMNSVVDQCTRE